MARSYPYNRDALRAAQLAGTPVGDGSGRIVRGGRVLSGRDAAAADLTQLRNADFSAMAGPGRPLGGYDGDAARAADAARLDPRFNPNLRPPPAVSPEHAALAQRLLANPGLIPGRNITTDTVGKATLPQLQGELAGRGDFLAAAPLLEQQGERQAQAAGYLAGLENMPFPGGPGAGAPSLPTMPGAKFPGGPGGGGASGVGMGEFPLGPNWRPPMTLPPGGMAFPAAPSLPGLPAPGGTGTIAPISRGMPPGASSIQGLLGLPAPTMAPPPLAGMPFPGGSTPTPPLAGMPFPGAAAQDPGLAYGRAVARRGYAPDLRVAADLSKRAAPVEAAPSFAPESPTGKLLADAEQLDRLGRPEEAAQLRARAKEGAPSLYASPKEQADAVTFKSMAEDQEATKKAGAESAAARRGVRRAIELLEGGARTGFGADAETKIRQIASELGLESKGLATMEELQANLGDRLMDRIGQTKGSISDYESRLFSRISASSSKTPEGNLRILRAYDQALQRREEASRIIQRGRREKRGVDEIDQELYDFMLNAEDQGSEGAGQAANPASVASLVSALGAAKPAAPANVPKLSRGSAPPAAPAPAPTSVGKFKIIEVK